MSRIEILLNFFGMGAFIGMKVGAILAIPICCVLFFFLHIFALIGILVGIVIGAFFGGINGLVLGIITAIGFNKDIPRFYGRFITIMAVEITSIIAIPILASMAPRSTNYPHGEITPLGILLLGIALIGAIYGGIVLSRWYQGKLEKQFTIEVRKRTL